MCPCCPNKYPLRNSGWSVHQTMAPRVEWTSHIILVAVWCGSGRQAGRQRGRWLKGGRRRRRRRRRREKGVKPRLAFPPLPSRCAVVAGVVYNDRRGVGCEAGPGLVWSGRRLRRPWPRRPILMCLFPRRRWSRVHIASLDGRELSWDWVRQGRARIFFVAISRNLYRLTCYSVYHSHTCQTFFGRINAFSFSSSTTKIACFARMRKQRN